MLALPVLLLTLAAPAPVQSGGDLTVLLDRGLSASEIQSRVRSLIAQEAQALNRVAGPYWNAHRKLGLVRPGIPFIAPRVVRLSPDPGAGLSTPAAAPITLVFDPDNSARGFTASYRQLLQDTFAIAKPTMDAMFGQPYLGGNIRIENHDNDIGDRDAVAGGFYLPNDGSGNQVIWFPVYNLPETAAVNFVHTLFLAYMGPAMPTYNGWSEGMARAATTYLVSLTGFQTSFNPDLEPDLVQSILDNSYDTSAYYDWYNQPPLGNNKFIPDNLRDLPLPFGGSLGGIFLMRYRQSGTAWSKFIDPYGPAFFGSFLSSYYTQFNLDNSTASNVAALKVIAQGAMDTLNGGPNATIEGQSFANWSKHQYILDTTISRGKRMFVEPIPITTGLFGSDFGVFAIWATYFETLASGNETLLSGTCYPLFWNVDFNRVFPEGQTDRMDIAAAFGEVTPNLTDDFGGDFYRAVVELPVADVIGRAIVPVGSIATPGSPIPKDFFGTVLGFEGAVTGGDPNVSGVVRITFLDTPATNPIDAPIQNGAFGVDVGTAFDSPRRLKLEVIKTDNGLDTTLYTEFVNSWGTTLAQDIRINDDKSWQPPGGLSAGVQALGFPTTPFETDMATSLGLNVNETLVARWRQDLFRYELYPSMAPFQSGRGYFVRMPAASPGFSISGRGVGAGPVSVALQPGWNLIGNPFAADLDFTSATIQRTVDLPRTLVDAANDLLIDPTIYKFNPGAPDLFSGVAEGGTLDAATNFAAGAAVYIRVLAPEGLTITFRPLSFTSSSSPQQNEFLWKGVLNFSGLGVEHSKVELGAKNGASPGYDPRMDSVLPPIWGGALQAQLGLVQPMYRDWHASGNQEWTIKLTGLRNGATYTLSPTLTAGSRNVPTLQFINGTRKTPLRNGTPISFVASSSEMQFKLKQVSQ